MKIFDTTIRDGSYAVDFKFSLADVEAISRNLESLGFEFIEIGHGMGLNASSPENGICIHSDIEYMEAAKNSLTHSKYGFFCIPGIARLADLEILTEHGGSFVRIGINADEISKTEEYVKEAKKLGLTTMVNFMKSYILTPEKFADEAARAEQYGADYVYIVDSAGYMLESDLTKYFEAIKNITSVKIGFHGHNNLGMAVANSLHCFKLGFDFIDCSLQGLGRSSGNASTEMMVMLLKKMGYDIPVDIPRLLEYGYTLLRDVTEKELVNPLNYICGYSGFHSGYLKDIYKCCCEYMVDPLRLIIAYCDKNKKNMDYNLLCEVAKNLPRDQDKHPYNFNQFFIGH